MTELVLERSVRQLGSRAALQRDVRHGVLERIAPGVYAPPHTGEPEDQHRLLMRAVQAKSAEEPIFSHLSAAVGWNLPVLRPLPSRVHLSVGPMTGGRSTTMIVRHGIAPGPIVERDGFQMTTLARTVVDVARTSTLHQAVSASDAALRGSDRDDPFSPRPPLLLSALNEELLACGRNRGVAVARAALDIADSASGSAGESCSRVTMALAGIPSPLLQAEFRDSRGLIGYVDFWWPEFNLIGEFDGQVKYTDPRFLRGRTPEQALRDEKVREDRLRAVGPRVARWGWKEAFSASELLRRLAI